MSAVIDNWTDGAGSRVLEQLRGRELAIQPKQVQVTEEVDAIGDDAWRVLLVLPAPSGQTWDREDVFEARRAAVGIFDLLAAEEDRTLPGGTVAFVTTDEAREEDIAPEDAPEDGEDPGYRT